MAGIATRNEIEQRANGDADRIMLKAGRLLAILTGGQRELIRLLLVEAWCDGRLDGLSAARDILYAVPHDRP
jgi:hypothetical protein